VRRGGRGKGGGKEEEEVKSKGCFYLLKERATEPSQKKASLLII